MRARAQASSSTSCCFLHLFLLVFCFRNVFNYYFSLALCILHSCLNSMYRMNCLGFGQLSIKMMLLSCYHLCMIFIWTLNRRNLCLHSIDFHMGWDTEIFCGQKKKRFDTNAIITIENQLTVILMNYENCACQKRNERKSEKKINKLRIDKQVWDDPSDLQLAVAREKKNNINE